MTGRKEVVTPVIPPVVVPEALSSFPFLTKGPFVYKDDLKHTQMFRTFCYKRSLAKCGRWINKWGEHMQEYKDDLARW